MNLRENFLNTINFKKAEKIPLMDFGYWASTIDRWHNEGLPMNIATEEQIEDYLGLDRGFEFCQVNGWNKGAWFRAYPLFEETVFEEDEETIVKNDVQGVKMRVYKKEHGIQHYLSYPVTDMDTFLEYAKRMNAKDAGRYSKEWYTYIQNKKQSTEPVGITLDGFLAWPREIVGVEELFVAYYEQPELIHAINSQHVEFQIEHINIIKEQIDIDYACFFEDMAYKTGSLISPAIFDEFMKPYYEKIVAHLKKCGVNNFLVDSDGNTLELCEKFIEVGMTGHYPLEIAAGSHPEVLREKYPNIALIGGIDKRALFGDKVDIDKELSKIPKLLEKGGYIPTIDHKVSPDVSFDNYKYYVDKKRELLEKYN